MSDLANYVAAIAKYSEGAYAYGGSASQLVRGDILMVAREYMLDRMQNKAVNGRIYMTDAEMDAFCRDVFGRPLPNEEYYFSDVLHKDGKYSVAANGASALGNLEYALDEIWLDGSTFYAPMNVFSGSTWISHSESDLRLKPNHGRFGFSVVSFYG